MKLLCYIKLHWWKFSLVYGLKDLDHLTKGEKEGLIVHNGRKCKFCGEEQYIYQYGWSVRYKKFENKYL